TIKITESGGEIGFWRCMPDAFDFSLTVIEIPIQRQSGFVKALGIKNRIRIYTFANSVASGNQSIHSRFISGLYKNFIVIIIQGFLSTMGVGLFSLPNSCAQNK